MAKAEVNRYACKLQLLQHGLVVEMHELDMIGAVGRKVRGYRGHKEGEGEDLEEGDEEGDTDILVDKRNSFVRKAIRESKESFRTQKTTEHITTVTRERRLLIREFMKAIGGSGGCNNCRG